MCRAERGGSVLAGVRQMLGLMPLEQANEDCQRMNSGDVRFRMVLTMQNMR